MRNYHEKFSQLKSLVQEQEYPVGKENDPETQKKKRQAKEEEKEKLRERKY